MTEIVLYLKNGLWCYQVEGGEMCCPPHVFSREEARRWFGADYKVSFGSCDGGYRRDKKPKVVVAPVVKVKPIKTAKVMKEPKPDRPGAPGRKSTAVAQYSRDGEFIKLWDKAAFAAFNLGCSQSAIQKCCSGQYATAAGHIWRWAPDRQYKRKIIAVPAESRKRCVVAKNLDGEEIARYESICAAAKSEGVSTRTLRYHMLESKTPLRMKVWEFAE